MLIMRSQRALSKQIVKPYELAQGCLRSLNSVEDNQPIRSDFIEILAMRGVGETIAERQFDAHLLPSIDKIKSRYEKLLAKGISTQRADKLINKRIKRSIAESFKQCIGKQMLSDVITAQSRLTNTSIKAGDKVIGTLPKASEPKAMLTTTTSQCPDPLHKSLENKPLPLKTCIQLTMRYGCKHHITRLTAAKNIDDMALSAAQNLLKRQK
jgi:hypothetical protein